MSYVRPDSSLPMSATSFPSGDTTGLTHVPRFDTRSRMVPVATSITYNCDT